MAIRRRQIAKVCRVRPCWCKMRRPDVRVWPSRECGGGWPRPPGESALTGPGDYPPAMHRRQGRCRGNSTSSRRERSRPIRWHKDRSLTSEMGAYATWLQRGSSTGGRCGGPGPMRKNVERIRGQGKSSPTSGGQFGFLLDTLRR